MKITNTYYSRILTLVLCVLLLLSYLCVVPQSAIVYADDSEDQYTGVIEDLSQDPEFSILDYPRKNLGAWKTDYSLSVIQIAESSDNELFVYVYQPCDEPDRRASSIRISTLIGDDYSPHDYSLTYLNHGGHSTNEATLFKYKVENLTVVSDPVRYYDIVCIFRRWDGDIDDRDENNNIINEVAYEVGQRWTAVTDNDEVIYHMVDSDVVIINPEDMYVDFLRYEGGRPIFFWYPDSCDSHYIAFSCDHQIDELYEADVSFITQKMYIEANLWGMERGHPVERQYGHDITLYSDTEVSTDLHGFKAKQHTWNRIERASDFLEKEDLTSEARSAVADKQWVLRFYESDYDYHSGSYDSLYYCYYTSVVEATILRLKFSFDGVVYNLGVVSSKKSGDNIPGNNINADLSGSWNNFMSWLKNIMSKIFGLSVSEIADWQAIMFLVAVVIVGIVILVILMPFLPSILSVLLQVFVWLGKGLLWLIMSPIRLIKALIRRGDK